MDLNKYLNNAAPSEPQYSKEDYAAMKKTEREAVWAQVDARMGEVLADAPALQEFLNFMSQCRNSLPNQLLLSGQNADITDARTFQQWKDAGLFMYEKSILMSTYILCGFANISSIGILLGGLGVLAPEKRGLISRIGVPAMIGGALVSVLSATIIGMILG